MTSASGRHFEIQTSATVGILQGCSRVLMIPEPSLGLRDGGAQVTGTTDMVGWGFSLILGGAFMS